MEATQAVNERPNSCEINISTKGIFSGSVKCYADTLENAFEETKKRAMELEAFLKEKNIGKE